MKKSVSLSAVAGVGLLGWLLAVVCMSVVFWPVLPKYAGLVAGDAMPFFAYPWRTLQIEELLASGSFTPHALYRILLDPLWMHELTFIVDSLVLMGAGIYYLRARGAHPLAALCGGLALGFSGYTFTLFSAGHRGYFHMFSCAVWAFGLIARGFETRRLFYYAMLGMVFAWGVPYQPDVLLLVGALAAAYALWLTFRGGSAHDAHPADGAARDVLRRVVAVWPRFVVSLVFMALAGFGGIRGAVTTQIANRDAQIASVTGKTSDAAAPSREKTAAEKRERWLFATNWSLPPEDVLEFVVPGVFGNESMQGAHPYWGRLGRPDDSVFQRGRMMPNYRQHTVYLGVIPVLLALLAVVGGWRSRRAKSLAPMTAAPAQPASALRSPASDVPFWCGVWIVCLLLAMGRYTPLYQAFYAIPYMDYIRAPVKFLHLVEIATAFLAGFGLDFFLRGEQVKARRLLLRVSLGAALLLGVTVLVALVAKAAIVSHIVALGLGQAAEGLGRYTLANGLRALAVACAVVCVAYVTVRRPGRRAALAIGCCLVAGVSLDQAVVARRYVKELDLEPFYRENAVVKAVRKEVGGRPSALVNYVTQNTWQDWFSFSLSANGIRNLTPVAEDRGTPYGTLFASLQDDPVRLWQVLHAEFVVVPRKSAESLMKAGALRPVLDFDLASGSVRQALQPDEKTLTLARVRDAAQGPSFVSDWQGGVPVDKQVEALVRGGRTVSDAPAASGPSSASVERAAQVLSRRGVAGALATRVRTQSSGAGLLVFDDRVTEKLDLRVDGVRAPLYTADGVWATAHVPAGTHEVVLRRTGACGGLLILSVAVALVLFVWGGCVMVFGWKDLHAGAAA